jgi:hypothetical protein
LHKNSIFNIFLIFSIISIFYILISEQIDSVYGLHMYTPTGFSTPGEPDRFKPYGKWMIYENSTTQPETELKGTVVSNNGNLWIVPDENYRNLLVDGNKIYPDPGQKGFEQHNFWAFNYKKAKGIPISQEVHPPVIRLETYPFGKDFNWTYKYEEALGETFIINETTGNRVPCLDKNNEPTACAPVLKNSDGSRYFDKSIIDSNSPCYNIKIQVEDLERELESLSFELNNSASPGEKSFFAKQIKKIIKEISSKRNEIQQCTETNPNHIGVERQVEPGDHIKIEGLYVIDIAHPMYYGEPACQEKFEQRIWPKLTTGLGKFKEFDEALAQTVFFPFRPDVNNPFSLLRLIVDLGYTLSTGGFLPISTAIDAIPWPVLLCYDHAELHPYKPLSIRLIEPLKPGGVNEESHIVAAPIPTQFVSETNKIMTESWSTYGEKDGPLAGRLVDFSTKKLVKSEFFMEAPPKPAICNSNPCILQFKEDIHNAKGPTSDPFKDGYIDVKKEFTNNPEGVKVIVTVKGEDILNPTIYSAKFSAWWEVGIIG